MLRNVKSRVDTSSPRSCTRTPVMSQSEKTFRKSTTQDIRKRFKNALHFTKKNKNNTPCTSPCPNVYHAQNEKRSVFKAGSEEPIHCENNPCTPTGHVVPRPTTRRNPGITPTVHPFTIRSYATDPPKNPKSCQHTCLHHKHCPAKNNTDIRTLNNISFQDKSVVQVPQMLPKSRVPDKQSTAQTEINAKCKNKDFFNTRFYTECIDPSETRVYVKQMAEPKQQSDDNTKYYTEFKDSCRCAHSSRNVVGNEAGQHHDSNQRESGENCIKLPNKPGVVAKSFAQQSSEEHDYILFLLRITEDIIANNFCLNDGIQNVFERHIEENKNHLDYRKMRHHIFNLCKELKIDCEDFSNADDPNQSGETAEPKFVFDKSIFRNCKRCTNLPMTPKLFLNGSSYNFDHKMSGNASDNGSISPSTVKMAEKISLGRVTECTEPLASTSTLNTPKIIEILPEVDDNVSRKLEYLENGHEPEDENFCFKQERKAFARDITGQGNLTQSSNKSFKVDLKQQYLFLQSLQARAMDSSENNKNMDFYINLDFQDNTTSQENSEDSFNITLKRPKKDFGKLSLDEVWSNTKNLVNQANFDRTKNLSSDDTENNDTMEIGVNIKSTEPVSMVEYFKENGDQNQCGRIASLKKISDYDSSENQQKHTDFLQQEYEQARNIEEIITNILKELTVKTKTECKQSNEIIDIFRNSKHATVVAEPNSDSSKSINQSSVESVKNGAKVLMISERESENKQEHERECTIRVSIDGCPKDGDFIFIKGPIYVLKGLLDVRPQLIILKEENIENPKSDILSHDSLDSLNSNKTYTIIKPNTTEEFDINIFQQLSDANEKHAPSVVTKQECIKQSHPEFSKKVDSLIKSSKHYSLSYSDYDLTPEKDNTDKYHHLLVDATTSVTHIGTNEQTKLEINAKPESSPAALEMPFESVVSSYEKNSSNKQEHCQSELGENQAQNEVSNHNSSDICQTLISKSSSNISQARKPPSDRENMEKLNITSEIIENNHNINLIEFSDSTIVTETFSNESIKSCDMVDQNKNNLDVDHEVLDTIERLDGFSVFCLNGNKSSHIDVSCKKSEASVDMLTASSSKENYIPIIRELDERDSKKSDEFLKDVKDGIEKINEKLESELKEKAILSGLKSAAAPSNKININQNVKLSRSEITIGKLFRMKDVFETERSLSANSTSVRNERFLK